MQTVRITGAVPALVTVQHPLGDRVDAEALEHAIADLRVALEDETLAVRQGPRLAEDLLGHGQLSEIVQACGETCQPDLLLLMAEARRDASGKLRDTLRMTA